MPEGMKLPSERYRGSATKTRVCRRDWVYTALQIACMLCISSRLVFMGELLQLRLDSILTFVDCPDSVEQKRAQNRSIGIL